MGGRPTATSAAARNACPAVPPSFAYALPPLSAHAQRHPYGATFPATTLASIALGNRRDKRHAGFTEVPFIFAVMALIEARRHYQYCPHRGPAMPAQRWALEELGRLLHVWDSGKPDHAYTWKRMWALSPLDRGTSLSGDLPESSARHILWLQDVALALIDNELYTTFGDTPPCRGESFTICDAEAVARWSETYSARAAETATRSRRPAKPAVEPGLSPTSPPLPGEPTTSPPSPSEERPMTPPASSMPSPKATSDAGESRSSLRDAPPSATESEQRNTRKARSTE